jgi:hypothetical protein
MSAKKPTAEAVAEARRILNGAAKRLLAERLAEQEKAA